MNGLKHKYTENACIIGACEIGVPGARSLAARCKQ